MAAAQNFLPQSKLQYKEKIWDFGTIEEQDGPVSHTFEFTNGGSKPVVIEDVAVSCGCTTPEYSRAPVRPGASGSVKVTYDPAGRPGVFSKEIMIYSGNKRNADIIRIKGEVKPKPRTREEEYPFLAARGLRFKESLLTFRYVPQGSRAETRLGYDNFSERDLRVEFRAADDGSGALVLPAPRTLKAGSRGEFTFAYDLRERRGCYGMLSDRITVVVNGQESPLPLSATAIGIDDPAAMDGDKAPRALLDHSYCNLGNVETGTAASAELTLTNEGRGPLHVRSVQTKGGVTATLQGGTTLQPGEKSRFEVTLDPSGYEPGRIFESIIIVTDDPQRPMRDLRLTAVKIE